MWQIKFIIQCIAAFYQLSEKETQQLKYCEINAKPCGCYIQNWCLPAHVNPVKFCLKFSGK